MYGRPGPKAPSKRTKGFKHVKQSEVLIRNFGRLLLTLKEQSTLTFQSKKDHKEEEIYFMIDTYDDLTDHKKGLLVAISCGISRKKFIVCVENKSIILKEGELPEEIPSENTEFIFYRKDSGSEDTITYSTFESTVERGLFLTSREDGPNLILKPNAEDKADKTTFSWETIQATMRFKPIGALGVKSPYYIRNSYDDYLIARPEESNANFESDGNTKGDQALFYMNSYRNTAFRNGIAVIFSCKVQNKNYLLCVASDSVIMKERELPPDIPTETSEYIFYVREFSTGKQTYLFESSLKPELRSCLAWNKEDAKKTLILKEYLGGSINEAMNFFMEEK